MDSVLELLPIVAVVAGIGLIFWRDRQIKKLQDAPQFDSFVFVKIPEQISPGLR